MSAFVNLCSLAVRPAMVGAMEALGLTAGRAAVEAVAGWLGDRFASNSDRLTAALGRANDRAWAALEFALGGETLWQRCTAMFTGTDERDFRRQVRAFLDSLPPQDYAGGAEAFRAACLGELRLARKENLLAVGALDVRMLARRAGTFAAFGDPASLLDAEARALTDMAGEFPGPRFGNLRKLLSLKPERGTPVLVAAARFFFRREVETDAALFQGLAMARMEDIAAGQRAGFFALEEALSRNADRIGRLLDLQEQTHGEVLQIKAAVQELLERHRMAGRELRPADSLSIRGDDERRVVKELVRRWRALPESQRNRPDLLNGLGLAQAAAGDFAEARADFAAAAAATGDSSVRAEARHNAYRAALEQRDYAAALGELREAVRLDPARFTPFPFEKYLPEAILGAGGFGVAFRCRDTDLDKKVVVKALFGEGLDRDVSAVFAEARALDELEHPHIIRLRHCGWADPARKARPYLVMNHFDGGPLDELIRNRGPLPAGDLAAVMGPVAEALAAAHARGVLHRDVKPANILASRDAGQWRIKLIDFGLAYKPSLLHTAGAAGSGRSVMAAGVAGTIGYAAPEQMGMLEGAAVGPASDIYGFGRTCCFLLFGNPDPTFKDYKRVPEPLAELLADCIAHRPDQRPTDFAGVLARLRSLGAGPAKPPAASPPVQTPPPPPPSSTKREEPAGSAWPSVTLSPPKPPPTPTPPTPPRYMWEPRVRALALNGKKIEAIKLYREMTGVGLAEAKTAVEAMVPPAGHPAGYYAPTGRAAGDALPIPEPTSPPDWSKPTPTKPPPADPEALTKEPAGSFRGDLLAALIGLGMIAAGGLYFANKKTPGPAVDRFGNSKVFTNDAKKTEADNAKFLDGEWNVTGLANGTAAVTFFADGSARIRHQTYSGMETMSARFRLWREGSNWWLVVTNDTYMDDKTCRYRVEPNGDNQFRLGGRDTSRGAGLPVFGEGKGPVFQRALPKAPPLGPYRTYWDPEKK